MDSENLQLFRPSVDELATLVEECARAGKQNISRFIEPAQGTLRRATSKRHHIIFGRRGSGKSSLLLKSAEELIKKEHPVAFVDIEPFKGHQYPDIIISVLLATFKKFKTWVEDCKFEIKAKRLWYTLFIVKKKAKEEVTQYNLLDLLQKEIEQLSKQLHYSDNAPLKSKTSQNQKKSKSGSLSVVQGLNDNTLEANIAKSVESNSTSEQEEE